VSEKKRKPAHEMSSDELVQYALSPEVLEHLKRQVAEADAKTEARSKKNPQGK
jgi:hypothetical protein